MDRTVKVWQIVSGQGAGQDTMECMKTYEGHTNFVYGSAILALSFVVTCSQDQNLKIWSVVEQNN